MESNGTAPYRHGSGPFRFRAAFRRCHAPLLAD